MITSSPEKPLSPDENGVHQSDFFALGSQCSVKVHHSDKRVAMDFMTEATAWIEAFEAKYSRFRPDSIVSRINAAAGIDWIHVDAETDHMFDVANDLFHRTNGIFDPTLLPLLRVWDWQSIHLKLPQTAEINAALALTGWHMVQRRRGAVHLPKAGMGLDFGGFGKEYAVDQLTRIACRYGISNALVDLGRDIFALGGSGTQPHWHLGIEDGDRPGCCWGELAVSDVAVSESGDFARYFIHDGVRYGHILDPRTGWPVANGMRAVTVIAPSCLQAGIYSTAVFVLGIEEGLELASHARGVEVCAQSETGIKGSRNFDQYLARPACEVDRRMP